MTRSIYSRRYLLFRELLVQARKEAGLTQAELAEKLEKPQSFVAKYESGERRLDVVEMIDIAEAIGASPVRIVERLALAPRAFPSD